jgi:hypothetical protein
MSKFSDQLFLDLMREHGQDLASARVPDPPRRRPAARPLLLTAGAGGLAIAATVAAVVAGGSGAGGSGGGAAAVAGGGSPAYSVTKLPDGTVSVAVYRKSGITGANSKLQTLDDKQVVIVPVQAGCPDLFSLNRSDTVGPGATPIFTTVKVGGTAIMLKSPGIPKGDVILVAVDTNSAKQATSGGVVLAKLPAPKCVSLRGSKQAPA